MAKIIDGKAISAAIRQEISEEVEKIKQESRRYAKRQLTWFNHVEGINWFYPDKSTAEDIAREIASLMESKETNV